MKVAAHLEEIARHNAALTPDAKLTCADAAKELRAIDRLLARAADELNKTPRMAAMDLGSEITEYRRERA